MSEGAATTTEAGQAAEGTTQAPSYVSEDAFNARIDQLQDTIASIAAPQEPEPAAEDPWEAEYGHLFANPGEAVQPEPVQQPVSAADAFEARESLSALHALAQRTQGQDQTIQALQSQIQQMQTQQDALALMERYPDFRDAEISREMLDQAGQMAARFGVPELATNVGLIELVYRASRADALAQSGVPAGGDVHRDLEGAGGAGASPSAEDVGQAIVGYGGGSIWGRR